MGQVHTPSPKHWTGPPRPPADAGGGGPYDPVMDARVAKLEAVVPTLATKEDLLRLEAKMHQELHALTWKLIGACAVLAGAVYFIARTVH